MSKVYTQKNISLTDRHLMLTSKSLKEKTGILKQTLITIMVTSIYDFFGCCCKFYSF